MRVALLNPAKGKRRTRGKKTKGRKGKSKSRKVLTPYQQHIKTQVKTKGKTFKQAAASWKGKHGIKTRKSRSRKARAASRKTVSHKTRKARRTHKVRKAGKVTAKFTGTLKTNPRRHRRKARRHVKRHKPAMANPRKRRRVRHKRHKPAMANPRKRRRSHRRRRNPEYPTIGGGFFPTWARIKATLMPHKPAFSDFIPTWAEIKAHPVYMAGGFVVGGVGSAFGGGIGRLMGGKNVLLGEVLALGGNILGFEVPARFIGLFNFRAKHHMVKGVRLGGIIVTAFSLIMGLVRIFKAVSGGKGVSGLNIKSKPTLGSLPKFSEIPKKIVNTLGLGTIGVGNPLADAVSSGTKTGYFKYEPMGVSDAPGYQGTEYVGDPNGPSSNYTDIYMGDLGGKIKELKEVLGLSDADITARMNMLGAQERKDEMPGVGQVVPPMYSGGPSRDFVV